MSSLPHMGEGSLCDSDPDQLTPRFAFVGTYMIAFYAHERLFFHRKQMKIKDEKTDLVTALQKYKVQNKSTFGMLHIFYLFFGQNEIKFKFYCFNFRFLFKFGRLVALQNLKYFEHFANRLDNYNMVTQVKRLPLSLANGSPLSPTPSPRIRNRVKLEHLRAPVPRWKRCSHTTHQCSATANSYKSVRSSTAATTPLTVSNFDLPAPRKNRALLDGLRTNTIQEGRLNHIRVYLT